MIREHPEYEWEQGHEARYFLLTLFQLQEYLQEGHIGWFFDPDCNVLQGKLTDLQLENMAKFVFDAANKMENHRHDGYSKRIWEKYLTR